MPRSSILNPKAISSFVTILAALVATLSYFAATFKDQQQLQRNAALAVDRSRILESQLIEQQKRADQINETLQRSLQEISNAVGKVPDSPESLRQIAILQQSISRLNTSFTKLSSQMDVINNALMTTPEKALTVPLLQKDVADLKTQTNRDIDALRGEMTRGYDLNRWLIGLILAALIGTVINNAIQSRSRPTHSLSNTREQPHSAAPTLTSTPSPTPAPTPAQKA
jgi:hypothetical protein